MLVGTDHPRTDGRFGPFSARQVGHLSSCSSFGHRPVGHGPSAMEGSRVADTGIPDCSGLDGNSSRHMVGWLPRHRIHNRIPSHRHAPSLHPCHFLSNLGNMSAASGVAYHVVDLSGECPADVFIHCVALGRNQPEFVPGHGIPTNSKTWRYHFRTGTSVDADRRSHSATDAVCRIPASRSPHRTTVACHLRHTLPAWRQKAPASSPCPHHLVSCILLWCRGSDGTLEQTGSAPGYCHAADMGTCFLCDACHSCHHASFGSHQSVAICHSGRCESLSRLCYLRRCLSHGLCTD